MIVQCCQCRRVLIEPDHTPVSLDKKAGGFWLAPKLKDPNAPAEVSQRLCPACAKAASTALDDYTREQGERLQAAVVRVVREDRSGSG